MVTVDAAIKKGRVQLFWVPLFIMLIIIILMSLGLAFAENGSDWVLVCGIGGFFLIFLLPFLYYFIMLPRWRIWAFTNVRNVHELKQRARLGQIVPKEDSFLWRFEIKSAEQADMLRNLEERFLQADIFEDDYSIPYQTDYSYSQSDKFVFIFFTLAGFAGAIVLFTMHQVFTGLIVLAGAVGFGVLAYKRFNITGPVLSISNEGITSLENGFHAWSNITNEQVFWVSAGEASYYALSYETNGQTIKLSLKELTGLSSYKVDHVLRTYRGRFQTGRGQRS